MSRLKQIQTLAKVAPIVIKAGTKVAAEVRKRKACYRCGHKLGDEGDLLKGLCAPCVRDRAQGETHGFYRHPPSWVPHCVSCGQKNPMRLRARGPMRCESCVNGGYSGRRGLDGWPGDDPQVVALAPLEAKLSKALVKARLPKPEAAVDVLDEEGRILSRIDLAYREARVAMYCDSYAQHADSQAISIELERRNALQLEGWTVLQFHGETLHNDLKGCVRTVKAALRAAEEAPQQE